MKPVQVPVRADKALAHLGAGGSAAARRATHSGRAQEAVELRAQADYLRSNGKKADAAELTQRADQLEAA